MFLEFFASTLLFFLVAFGLAWSLAARLVLAPAEKIVACVSLSLIAIFLVAWVLYILALPAALLWALVPLAVISLAADVPALVATSRDPDVRRLIAAQLLVSGWCLAWLALVSSYSGGGWAGDWIEHWQRTRFFLERLPRDFQFLGFYSLTARPPLANVITAAFLQLSRGDFAHYQLFSTLLGSVSFLPAALLARRFGDSSRAIAILAVLFMLNPLFVQNSTFAWTKLPAAFFVLTALYFFLREHDVDPPRAAAALFAASLAAGILAHYSAGPYAVVLGAAWLVPAWRHGDPSRWRKSTFIAAGTGAAILASWFAWSLVAYGAHETFLSNSSVTASESQSGGQLAKMALNLRDTLVPHFLRPLDVGLIAQTSPWGYWRDWFFQLYQLNLFFAFGSIAWLALLLLLARGWHEAERGRRSFWAVFAAGVILLGVAVHGARDTWGLTHICLQPLVLVGLAFLAGRSPRLGSGWKLVLVAGATVDLALGIALHFAVQNFAPDRWFAPGRPIAAWLASYSAGMRMNLRGKLQQNVLFFSDALAAPALPLVLLLAALLALGLMAARRHTAPKP